MLKFAPTHKYNQLFNFAHFYGNIGSKKFDGTYSERQYLEFLEKIKVLNIPSADWPYYEMEDDFYTYNSMGYRTYEFSSVLDRKFDIAIGCSFTEGIGVRRTEMWVHHLEEKLNTKILNLGKGGSSAKYVKHTLFSWVLTGMPLPERVCILWTEPTRKTFIRQGGAPQHLNVKWKIDPTLDLHDRIINEVYDKSILSNTMWSNDFIEDYCAVNTLLKSLNVKVYNFLIKSMWNCDVNDFEKYTGIVPHVVDFTKGVSGWYFSGSDYIFPGYDGVHFGEKHQISISNQIYGVINNE
jgi:hypothetical protein